MINIAHMAHIAPLPCAHTPLHAQKMSLCYRLEGRGGGCGRHDEIYLIPGNILMIPTRPPPLLRSGEACLLSISCWSGLCLNSLTNSVYLDETEREVKKMSRQHCLLCTTHQALFEKCQFFFNVGYNLTSSALKDDKSSVLTYHRIIEAFKFSYAWRSLLGDPYFNSDIKVGGNHSVVQIMPVFTFYVRM